MDNLQFEKTALPDKELVRRLLEMDAAAWEYVCIEVIAPMTKMSKYTQMFSRYSIPLESIVSQVYLDLTEDDCRRLRKFRFEGAFRAWLFFQMKDSVKRIFSEAAGKVPLLLSENISEGSHIEQEKFIEDIAERKLKREEMNYCIAQLWKESPIKAYVLLLRGHQDLSAKETGMLLGKNNSNIDQVFRRAKRQLRDIMKEQHLWIFI